MAGITYWGGDYTVSAASAAAQPVVAGLANGRYVVTWTVATDGSGSGIHAQVFNADGSKYGNEITVNTTLTGDQTAATITALADGTFAIAWTDASAGSSNTNIRARLFSQDGVGLGSDFIAIKSTSGNQLSPSIAALPDGGFVTAYQTANEVGFQIYKNGILDVTGLVNTTHESTANTPVVTAMADGRFVVTWYDTSSVEGESAKPHVRAQIFNADGTRYGSEFLVHEAGADQQYSPTTTALADGHFVIAWSTGTELKARIYNPDGSPAGDEFKVDTATNQPPSDIHVTALADGGFAVTWNANYPDLFFPGHGHLLRTFNADGSGASNVIEVDRSSFLQDIWDPEIDVLADGRIVAVRTDYNFDFTSGSSSTNVVARIYDPRDAGVTLAGTGGSDHLIGTNYADLIMGGSGNDKLEGRGGNDSLVGGSGNDTLDGGNGDDLLDGGFGADLISGGNGIDTLIYNSMPSGSTLLVDLMAPANNTGEAYGDTYWNIENITGSEQKDIIRANSDNNVLMGRGGDDLLDGRDGNDTLDGGTGADLMVGGAGDDTYWVDNALDQITEDAGGGTDRVYATADYTLEAGVEIEHLIAKAGATGLHLSGSAVSAFANRIVGGRGNDTLDGGAGDDVVVGGEGDDAVIGGDGADRLTGGDGADRLTGGSGRDVLIGGGGSDHFVFAGIAESPATSGRDVIRDFVEGEDMIELSQIDADANLDGDQAFTWIGDARFTGAAGELRAHVAGANTVVAGDVDGDRVADFQILLQGTHTLTGADFLL